VTVAALPVRFARLVKIEHTVFALPFAYIGALLSVHAIPSAHDLVWITIAMVGARSVAMALNRLIDAEIDARNPRTERRELPAGLLSRGQVVAFAFASGAVYVVAAFQLAHIVRWLWPIPLALFVVYPYLKRWTWLGHAWLGIADGLAPVGGWVAVTGGLPWEAWLLGAAVATWVTGFDLFYSLFDREVDIAEGLQSVATRFGVRGAFIGARLLHAATIAFLVAVGIGLALGWWYWIGVAVVALLLAYEHSLVRPDDLRRLDAAFFTVNGVISVAFCVFVVLEVAA
jgi:4-hydroxybenzoate polyprenyltransferase